jgi:hypothetical protein
MSDVPEIGGKPAAKIHIHLEEKVGLPNYSNMVYGASVTRYVEDSEDLSEELADAGKQVEGWMTEYFRVEVQPILENAAGK